jgi:serine/threonine protein kinase
MKCPACDAEVFEMDVKCANCGAAIGATGAHRMLGQVVLGTYELVDVLGQGGMSVVFKAKHKMTDQEVALKILPPELAAHSQVKSRFLEEAKALAALDHPNIVHLYNFGQENGSFVLAMQFVQGKTWERLILENKRLDWKVSCRITIDVLKALEYAHGRGVIHRDMKPSNVLVRAHDAAATVMDFGIAKMAQSTRLTATGQTMGTVRYMSPEQVRGQEVDLRTDLYSLGATLYESLVGDTPFDGQTHFEIMTKHLSEIPKRPSTHGVDLPPEVEDVLMRSLAKKVEDRFEAARDMRKQLESALRTGDVGLVETQRLNREILGENGAQISSPGLAPTARAASAMPLADELEPGMTGAATAARPKGRSKWPWIALAISVLAAGGVGAAIILTTGTSGYQPQFGMKGVSLVQGKRFDDLHLMVETDGNVTPDDVVAAYREALVKAKAFQPKIADSLDVIDHIVAIPAKALCEPSAYPAHLPEDCASALEERTYGKGASRVLLVLDDKVSLGLALRHGVAHAVCDFQPSGLSPEAQLKTCDLANRFVGSK